MAAEGRVKGGVRGPGDRPVTTLPREAGQGGRRPPRWPGAASARRRARRGSGGRSPAPLSWNTEQAAGYGGPPAAFRGSGESRGPTCRATPEGGTGPEPPPPWPRAGRRAGRGGGGEMAGSADTAPAPPRPPGTAEEPPAGRPGTATRPDPGGRRRPGPRLGHPTRRAPCFPGGLSPLGPRPPRWWSSLERKGNK